MREVYVFNTPQGSLDQKSVESPVPQPGPGEVLIRVAATGLNPKDWKYTNDSGTNQGDDIAGYVEAFGDGVRNFRIGDRVLAYHDMLAKSGGYAEFAIAGEHVTVHLPDKVSFEDAATIPLPALTASLALYHELDDFPFPWKPAQAPVSLLVYGGSSTVGLFTIKIAALANIHPIITVAGGGAGAVKPFLDASKGDTIVDYRQGHEVTVASIKKALQGKNLLRAVNAVATPGSGEVIAQVIDQTHGQTAKVWPSDFVYPGNIRDLTSFVKCIYSEENTFTGYKSPGPVGCREFGRTMMKLFAVGLNEGWFSGHPAKLTINGLDGLAVALTEMKIGKVSAQRYVARIADTPGLSTRS